MLKRTMLLIELIVLCGPAIALLCFGALSLPALLIGSISGGNDWHIGVIIVICGLWGSISLTNLVWHVFKKPNNWPGRPIQWWGLAMGIVACIMGIIYFAKPGVMSFIFIGPVIATLHLLYLSQKPSLAL